MDKQQLEKDKQRLSDLLGAEVRALYTRITYLVSLEENAEFVRDLEAWSKDVRTVGDLISHYKEAHSE